MEALGGVIALLLLAMWVGKHTHRASLLVYAAITIIAAAQVGVVLYMMFSMQIPRLLPIP